jgi:hypothetical protein
LAAKDAKNAKKGAMIFVMAGKPFNMGNQLARGS